MIIEQLSEQEIYADYRVSISDMRPRLERSAFTKSWWLVVTGCDGGTALIGSVTGVLN